MSKEGIPPREYRLQYIRGLPIFHSPRFSKENFEAALDYQPQDGDIIIASYPKTGTTWLQYIVLQILSKGKSFPSFNDLMFKEAPYLEMAGIASIEALKKPRVYKHHFPYNLVKKNEKAKCVYIYRNPEDTVVSFYHHTQSVTFNSDIDFDQYVKDFISANVPYGSYFEHVKSYLDHKDDNNLLILTYEGLHSNTKEEFLKIAKFLGEEYYKALSNDDSLLNKIIKQTSFENMKNNLYYVLPDTISKDSFKHGPQKVEFFRKGTTGEGKKRLSPEQQDRLREVAEKVLEGTDAMSKWYSKEITC
ncbi:sulfotransferase 1B1-like [Argiope bruennichi]|uniref:Sulfotransferase family cytosolic 1B member 1 like protein n=1 Tax=Argiope bruennichi TaxID=94029 RepID=A0A8T0F7U8_ARGBR|nr:sulfotransferase 1B1-like [Argiope bruennichi]KAF8787284.1 Sulfotransferase family cytosolic 1B member 1 like protein [Argiope bruennichi]